MAVITAGRTSGTEYDVKALFLEWAIHRFLCKVSSLKAMQVEYVLLQIHFEYEASTAIPNGSPKPFGCEPTSEQHHR